MLVSGKSSTNAYVISICIIAIIALNESFNSGK